jgi:hypothetical protein
MSEFSSLEKDRALDAMCATFVACLAIVAIVFQHRVPHWERTAFNLLVALDDPVRTRKYKGFVHGQGGTSAGLSGEFTGWVSDDEAAIPLQAEMKVLLGSIHLELERWTRAGMESACV